MAVLLIHINFVLIRIRILIFRSIRIPIRICVTYGYVSVPIQIRISMIFQILNKEKNSKYYLLKRFFSKYFELKGITFVPVWDGLFYDVSTKIYSIKKFTSWVKIIFQDLGPYLHNIFCEIRKRRVLRSRKSSGSGKKFQIRLDNILIHHKKSVILILNMKHQVFLQRLFI